MKENSLVGSVPTGKKSCPYGLRDRDGNCIPISSIYKPTREEGSTPDQNQGSEEDPSSWTFPPFLPYKVNPRLRIPIRLPAPSTRKISKTRKGFAEKKHALSRTKPLSRKAVSRLPGNVRTVVSNMNVGDEVYTAGKRSREKLVSPASGKARGASKAVAKATLAGKAGVSALTALDIGVTVLEHIDDGMKVWEAVSQIPGEYFDAFKGLAEDAYDAVKDKDFIRLGEVVVTAVNPTTPVVRAIDYASKKAGGEPIASQAYAPIATWTSSEYYKDDANWPHRRSGIDIAVEGIKTLASDTRSWVESKLPKLR